MKVLKFGGTSLESADRMKQVAEICSQQQSVFVVLSAVSGTTNALTDIDEALRCADIAGAQKSINQLHDFYNGYIKQLYNNPASLDKASVFIQQQFSELAQLIQKHYQPFTKYHLLATGELISTELFHLYLQQIDANSTLINALDLLRLNEEKNPDEKFLAESINQLDMSNTETKIFITQGFICRNAFGEIFNLGRGGSDYSASLIGAAINAEEIQIWTDIDGMHNNDPRVIENTRAVRTLSFNEAAELAYFGAKILHPTTIKPAKRKNIPVRLLNTLQPSAEGTFISASTTRAIIKAVAAKDGITAIKIRSSEMLQAPGFLRRIFEVFELYKTSIDMITTSEVAVSVTIDDDENLSEIIKTLNEFASVEIDQQLAIICVVGEFINENKDAALQVIQSLSGIAIRMISYGGSAHNISLLVASDDKVAALKALHGGLFNV